MDLNRISYLTHHQLINKLGASPFRRPAVFLSRSAADRWGVAKHLQNGHRKGELCWVESITAMPTQYSVSDALVQVQGFGADGLIAIGGGSTIDTAKAVSALLYLTNTLPGDVLQAILHKGYLKAQTQALPIVAVPTTSGTGSEVTQWATVWDSGRAEKYSLDAPFLCPTEAWIVPELTHSLPAEVTLSTGLDAVCHAAESYWARASNPMVGALAVQALQILTGCLESVLKRPLDRELRQGMSTGALLAGLAFSQTRTTACHSISYPLTSLFGIEHGFACAITLSRVAEHNARVVDLKPLLAVFAPYGGIQEWLDHVCGSLVRLRLSSFQIVAEDIPEIVKYSFTGGRMDNNPVNLTAENVTLLLEQCL